MHIKRLTAENIKKIKVVDITPDGSVVQITGANGSGKSSVLDAIYWALAGTKNIDSQPVRQGSTSARIRLELGEVTVIRRFTENGTTLTVEAESGARFPSPQTLLDELLGSLTFDPLAFSRMEPKRQLEQLRRLVKLEVDVEMMASQIDVLFGKRTEVNRRVKALAAQADAIPVADGLPDTPIDVSAILEEMETTSQRNAEVQRKREAAQTLQRQLDQERESVRDLEAQLEKKRTWIAKTEEDLAARRLVLAESAVVDVSVIRNKFDRAQRVNDAIKERARYLGVMEQKIAAAAEAQHFTDEIERLTQERATAIAGAVMPVEGLSFGDGEVLYNGLPLSQASGAEQLRVSVAIAMAGNPKLRVLRIKEGSLLDENGMALVAQMAEAADFQVWLERVDTSGKVGVVMEDGMVAGAESADVGESVEAAAE